MSKRLTAADAAIKQLRLCERVFDKAARGPTIHWLPPYVVERLRLSARQTMPMLRNPQFFYDHRNGEENLKILCRLLRLVQFLKAPLKRTHLRVQELLDLKDRILEILVLWPRDRMYGTDVEVAVAEDNHRWLSVRVHSPRAHRNAQFYHWPKNVVPRSIRQRIAEVYGQWPPARSHRYAGR